MGVALAGRRRGIRLGVAVVVLALLAFGVVRALTAGATREDTTAAETAEVDRGEVTTEVATTGTLQAAQTRSLSFAVSGTVETVKVRPGTTVTAGQKLAAIDDADAAEAVEDAEAALDDALEALAKAEDDADSPSSCTGGNVAAALQTSYQPSPSPSPSPSASAPPSGSPAPAASATARPAKSAAPALSCSALGSRSGNGDPVLTAEQRVNQARLTLEKAEEALDGATITAPIAGKILTVGGKVGSKVSSGAAFITVADVYDMQISADFPEADADHLAVSQPAVVTLADRPGETFLATVVQVDPVGTSDGTLTRFGVVLAFDEAPAELLVGQSASVRVTTGSKDDVVRVPSTAVHDLSGATGTVRKGGTPTEVRIGLRGDQYTEITSGLTEGDVVSRS
ncbi:efflux RND transporter periplasmic adaptor subunit [Actinoplanes aureus]|uniref:Efflux RND transporter periplasmic adaptor subunit n=1 Tax=Actinoplanes aureus TaxID=2792083 RepID=A0A931C7U1_9ACTN|nr:efflux RND transporter periplasmic adaptor subunit [Actinoplanes aureus]MBG0562297.1 efflux RND transporter periplasmic adaptor subunit [Actinoplanes aureus]